MSSRRSGRAKAPVKYTSDSDDSDFGNKKPRKSKTTAAAPKKRSAKDEAPAADAAPKKRTKKDPEQLAADAAAAQSKADKASHKHAWESWLKEHEIAEDERLLDEEPEKDVSITQTDAGKKYGVKKEELSVLKHFEKRNPNPLYKNDIKLFLESEVKELGWRKAGMLAGEEGEEAVEKGEEIWKEEHKDDEPEAKEEKNNTKKDEKKEKKPAKEKAPNHKKAWTSYLESQTHPTPLPTLTETPEESINQSDCKTKYNLVPADLVVLNFFPKPNPKYGNTTKLFNEDEVKELAYRKTAVLAGVEGKDEEVLEKGKKLFEEGKN